MVFGFSQPRVLFCFCFYLRYRTDGFLVIDPTSYRRRPRVEKQGQANGFVLAAPVVDVFMHNRQ